MIATSCLQHVLGVSCLEPLSQEQVLRYLSSLHRLLRKGFQMRYLHWCCKLNQILTQDSEVSFLLLSLLLLFMWKAHILQIQFSTLFCSLIATVVKLYVDHSSSKPPQLIKIKRMTFNPESITIQNCNATNGASHSRMTKGQICYDKKTTKCGWYWTCKTNGRYYSNHNAGKSIFKKTSSSAKHIRTNNDKTSSQQKDVKPADVAELNNTDICAGDEGKLLSADSINKDLLLNRKALHLAFDGAELQHLFTTWYLDEKLYSLP